MKQLKIFLFTFSIISLLGYAGTALAHATPLSYEPDGSTLLQTLPAQIRIHFSENVEPKASSIIVYDPQGNRIDNNDDHTDPKDGHFFSVSLKNSGQGSYTVSWQVVSADDGHFTQGAYVFSVGHASNNPADTNQTGFQIQHSSGVPEGMTIGLEIIGEALLLGLLTVLAFLWRPIRKKYFVSELKASDKKFLGRLNFILIFGLLLSALGAISYLILKTNELKGLQGTLFNQAFWTFITTLSARYTVYRLVLIIIFFIIFWFRKTAVLQSEKMTKTEMVLFGILALTALARARVSHAAASNFYPNFSIAVNFIHLYFKDLWIGGLLAMMIVLSPIIKQLQNLQITSFILTSFSKITSVALGVAGVSGVYIVWLHLKSVDNILTTDWGNKFIILSLFGLLLLLVRLIHQLYLEPLAIQSPKNKRALSWLYITLPFEAVTGIFILLVTGVLIITTPPLSNHFSFKKQQLSQGLELTLTQAPYDNSKFLITTEDTSSKQLMDPDAVIVTLTNSSKNIGPITAPLEERFVGGYMFDQSLLSPPGNWEIAITAQRSGAYDAVADFTVNYPDDINYSVAHAQDRTFGWFEILNIAAAIIILISSILLYQYSDRLNKQIIKKLADDDKSHVYLSFYENAAPAPAIIVALFIFILFGGAFGHGHGTLLESNFQQLCEKNADITFFAWHESVPERAGKATSDLAVPGCMIGTGLGQYHFADEREFLYFTRTPEAQASMQTVPQNLKANEPATLTFKITDYDQKPVQELTLDHDRILHVIIVRSDFSSFAHVHVEDNGPVTADMLAKAEFPVKYTFPKAGKYLVAVDFTVRAKPFFEQFYVEVSGSQVNDQSIQDFSTDKTFDGYQVSLKTLPKTLTAKQPITLNYHIEQNGQAVKDLQPYLSVPMHISVISEDLLEYSHIHGLLPISPLDEILGNGIHAQHFFLPNKFGPDITANLTFPIAGVYHIFGEFKHNNKVVTTDFMVNVK